MAIGPLLAGLLCDLLSWRWFFLINIPLGFISAVYFLMTSSAHTTHNSNISMDYAGSSLLIVIVVIVATTVNLVATSQNIVQAFLLIFSLLLAAFLMKVFLIHERKAIEPILDPDIITNRMVLLGCCIRGMLNFSFYAFLVTMGLFLNQPLHYSAIASGFILLPMTVSIGILSPIGGKIIDQIGPFKPAFFGILAYGVGYFLFAVSSTFPLAKLLLFVIFPGIGYGLSSPSVLAITMSTVPKEKGGLASGFFYLLSLLSSSFGISCVTIVVNYAHLFAKLYRFSNSFV